MLDAVKRRVRSVGQGTYSWADINRLDAVAQFLFVFVRHCVGDDNLLELAAVQCLDGITAQDTVRDDCERIFCAFSDQNVCGLDESATGIGHVIDKDGRLALDVSNENHAGDLVGAGTLLVNESKAEIQAIGDRCCPTHVLGQVSTCNNPAFLLWHICTKA